MGYVQWPTAECGQQMGSQWSEKIHLRRRVETNVLTTDVIGWGAPAGEKGNPPFPVSASEGHPREQDVIITAAVRRCHHHLH